MSTAEAYEFIIPAITAKERKVVKTILQLRDITTDDVYKVLAHFAGISRENRDYATLFEFIGGCKVPHDSVTPDWISKIFEGIPDDQVHTLIDTWKTPEPLQWFIIIAHSGNASALKQFLAHPLAKQIDPKTVYATMINMVVKGEVFKAVAEVVPYSGCIYEILAENNNRYLEALFDAGFNPWEKVDGKTLEEIIAECSTSDCSKVVAGKSLGYLRELWKAAGKQQPIISKPVASKPRITVDKSKYADFLADAVCKARDFDVLAELCDDGTFNMSIASMYCMKHLWGRGLTYLAKRFPGEPLSFEDGSFKFTISDI